MRDINDIHNELWHIKVAVVVLVWEFAATAFSLFIVSPRDMAMFWWILTAIVAGTWFIVVMLHREAESARERKEFEEKEAAEKAQQKQAAEE